MNRKIYLILIVLCFLIASYAAACVNEFASVFAAFVCIAGLICCYKLFKQPEPYWDNPLWDSTDAAHPAFWRGEEHSCNQFCRLIKDVLSGKNKCKGRMYEPLETVRNSVFELKNELQEEQAINKSSFQTIDMMGKNITELTTERDVALEQRTADWERIHSLEKATNKLVEEINGHKDKCFDDIQICKNCKASLECERLDYFGYRDYCKWED